MRSVKHLIRTNPSLGMGWVAPLTYTRLFVESKNIDHVSVPTLRNESLLDSKN